MRMVMLLFLIPVFIVSPFLWDTGGAQAGYLPNAIFFDKMEMMLKLASNQTSGIPLPAMWREIKTGEPFHEGEVAYFFVIADSFEPAGVFWQLEEWKMQPGGYFLITYTKMSSKSAVRWHTKATTARKLIFEGIESMAEERLDITSPEVIEASERTQKLLMEHGFPVLTGGTPM